MFSAMNRLRLFSENYLYASLQGVVKNNRAKVLRFGVPGVLVFKYTVLATVLDI